MDSAYSENPQVLSAINYLNNYIEKNLPLVATQFGFGCLVEKGKVLKYFDCGSGTIVSPEMLKPVILYNILEFYTKPINR